MANYPSNYTGQQVDGAVAKVIATESTVTQNSNNLITSGAVYSHVASTLGNINTALAAIIGEDEE
jgi:hypothetical protein